MIIIGIDPGYGRCGFAILEKKDRDVSLLSSGVITTSAQKVFSNRLLEIVEDFESLLKKYNPEILSIEDLFFVENVTTGIPVAQVRGALMYLASRYGLRICEPKPVEIKKSFTGNGKATKEDMKRMVHLIFKDHKIQQIDDAADAIAAAHYACLLEAGL